MIGNFDDGCWCSRAPNSCFVKLLGGQGPSGDRRDVAMGDNYCETVSDNDDYDSSDCLV